MAVTAELADGRRLEFPDGTDPAVVQATVKRMVGGAPPAAPQPVAAPIATPAAPEPSDTAVAANASNKALAGIPDALLNTPNNVMNLGKAAFGSAATAFGRPDMAPELTPNPDYATRGARALGLIKPEAEPVNARQRIIDALTQGGVGLAVNPASTGRQMVTNAVTGMAGGAAAGATKELTGSESLAQSVGMLTPAATAAAGNRGRTKVAEADFARQQNEVADKTLAKAREEGYVFPPSETNPSFINNRLNSIAGKAATNQEAGVRNQSVTSRLAAEELGMPPGTALTEGRLAAYRDSVSQPYRDVAALSNNAKTYLEMLKEARFNATDYSKFYQKSGDPNARVAAEKFKKDATDLENKIEAIAIKNGTPGLVADLRESRQKIAKAHDIEESLNLGDAGVSANTLGKKLDNNAPLSGNLETIAKVNRAFPNQTQDGAKIPPANVSKTEAIISALLGTGGAATMGPAGMALGALPLLSGPTRSLILSKPYQDFMAKPDRSPSMLNRGLAELPEVSPQQQAIQALLLERAMAERR